jgi:hypothetical protein
MATSSLQDLFQVDKGNFVVLVNLLKGIFLELTGPVGTEPPWQPATNSPSEDQMRQDGESLRKAIEDAKAYLPIDYRKAFADPLLENLDHVLRSRDKAKEASRLVEAIVGAVVQHSRASVLRPALRQFLAVVSNLYRSFLASDKRATAGVPLAVPGMPPLVAFAHGARPGPFVLPTPQTRLLCGSAVAVVSLPSTYAASPLTWVPLAHEASGHGILHADPNLLPDLVAGVRSLFGGGPLAPGAVPKRAQVLGLVWSYWIDETAADVYGLLNVGPAFALNLAAFLAAQRKGLSLASSVLGGDEAAADPDFLLLEASSVSDPGANLDVHPPDLLRLFVAIGVIENLEGLPTERCRSYIRALEEIAAACLADQTRARINGLVEVERDRWVQIDNEFDIAGPPGTFLNTDDAPLLESARRVGAYIATTRLGALGNHTIQEVETWDEADELVALSICKALVEAPDVEESNDDDPVTIAAMGDDAQLLAGATLAAFAKSSAGSFAAINRRLARALDRSFMSDPLMGYAEMHPMLRDRAPLGGRPLSDLIDDARAAAPKTGAALEPAPGRTPAAESAPSAPPRGRSRGAKTAPSRNGAANRAGAATVTKRGKSGGPSGKRT